MMAIIIICFAHSCFMAKNFYQAFIPSRKAFSSRLLRVKTRKSTGILCFFLIPLIMKNGYTD
ncbi:MAG: hypothetical protein COZ46_01490 [Verrucomicrobia bacterium CG_4_10_14_3_um_filter_43_23]|nr:MAG: hypothetical protein COX01_03095 [Verrucomicrobia bacterium CG22_combo_CG10-13_8_21_14_all_43_17]PIX58872.1 MAG: hypothetical protein COZ46_01490 [Verrucomicrobia bacterium CG_4_10_14_3_um_filter_43_23]PIY61648.1 MAG: hypothetical protein COY94_04075 [Verrucomicrobia bacterium CG_4_10_14_0_8_um_filter_43_34]